jgi:hypothetical protein
MTERIGRAKAIRLKCIDCCAGNMAEVRKCPAINCPLWRFRMGREVKDEDCVENNVFFDEIEDEDSE